MADELLIFCRLYNHIMPYGSKHAWCAMNGACLLAMWQATVCFLSSNTVWPKCECALSYTCLTVFLLRLHCGGSAHFCLSLYGTLLVVEGLGDLLCYSIIFPEEKVWPISAEKVGILGMFTACGGLHKIVRERYLLLMRKQWNILGLLLFGDGFFQPCLILSVVKTQSSWEMCVSFLSQMFMQTENFVFTSVNKMSLWEILISVRNNSVKNFSCW